jgi:hypothetical protein
VSPRQSDALELTVEGEILNSDGEQLVVNLEARDAAHRVWLQKLYRIETRDSDFYLGSAADPYQRLFNTFANDLVDVRRDLPPGHIRTLQQVAEIRFAEEFSPEAFQGYLEPDETGQLELVRLPARNDPMFESVMEARGREAMFIDTLNGQYMRMCGAMSQSYLQWRESSRSETMLERQARQKKTLNYFLIPIVIASVALLAITGNSSGVIYAAGALGGLAVTELAKNAQQHAVEADLHRATIEELEISFEGEVKPMVVELQGVTRKLSGSIDEQYEEWRRLLEEIYKSDTETNPDASAPLAPLTARSGPGSEDATP